MADFRTKSLTLLTYLYLHGYEPKQIDSLKEPGGFRVSCCFEDGEQLRELIGAYQAGKALVEPRKYTAARHQIRTRLIEVADA